MHWVWIGAALVLVAAVAWRVFFARPHDWKPLNERMVDQVTRSAELARECACSINEGRSSLR